MRTALQRSPHFSPLSLLPRTGPWNTASKWVHTCHTLINGVFNDGEEDWQVLAGTTRFGPKDGTAHFLVHSVLSGPDAHCIFWSRYGRR